MDCFAALAMTVWMAGDQPPAAESPEYCRFVTVVALARVGEVPMSRVNVSA
jgi:hypothetical protein